jgi:hypothetical protein
MRKAESMPQELLPIAKRLTARGFATPVPSHVGRTKIDAYAVCESEVAKAVEPQQVWLPRTLIDGAVTEKPPVELIRETRKLETLCLLVQCYATQFLPEFGGIPRSMLGQSFKRQKIGEQGEFVVWGFSPKSKSVDYSFARLFYEQQEYDDGTFDGEEHDVFWAAEAVLTDLGLLQWVPILIEGNDAEAEFIHPYGVDSAGEVLERQIGSAAARAAVAMLTPGQLRWAQEQGYSLLAPGAQAYGQRGYGWCGAATLQASDECNRCVVC